MQAKQFTMTKPSMAGVYIFGPLILFCFVLAAAFFYFVVGGKAVTVDDQSITVSGSFYGEEIQRSELQLEKAQVVDLKGEYYPTYRTGGFELFGYKEGWFELKNGEKALLVVSTESRIVYIPTAAGWAVMVSVADPEGFLNALRSSASGK